MIGRFLLGAGLGALTGTGLLVMVAMMVPVQSPVPPQVPAADAPAPEAPPAPQEGEAPAGPATPDAATTLPVPAAPADPGGEGAPEAPETPAAAPGGVADAAPAGLSAPETAEEAAEEAGRPAASGDTGDDATAGTDAPARPEAPGPEAAPPMAEPAGLPPLTAEEEALLAEIAEKGPEAVVPALVDPGTAPEAGPVPEPTPEAASGTAEGEPPADSTPVPAAPAPLPQAEILPEPPVPAPEPAAEPATEPAAPGSTLAPTPTLPGRVEGVETGRLPSIGGEPAAAAAEAASSRPLDLFARPFANEAGKPLFGVVLVDTGEADLDRAALAALPFPVSFAIDPQAPDAAAHAAIYRAAGQEVVMIATALPRGASASDVEVAFSVMEKALPEAVVVMDRADRLFQGDRPLSSLVVPAVGAQGRGLLTWDEGLNAADQVARREDVPAAVVFRNLDAGDEEGTVIRRYLDRAAFKAAQVGGVTVVGRTRPETVAALLEWTVEGRAGSVALAPVSAMLTLD